MGAVLPRDLLNISSTEIQYNSSTNNADIVFERAQVLHMFWKVHAIRYKMSRQTADERSRNLFWRTWSNPKFSGSINTSTLTALWDTCRGDLDLSTFKLVVKSRKSQAAISEDNTASHSTSLTEQSSDSKTYRQGSYDPPRDNAGGHHTAIKVIEPQHDTIQSSEVQNLSSTDETQEMVPSSRPKPLRSTSARSVMNRTSNVGRERGSARGRARPSLARRRSTQSGKVSKSPILGPRESRVNEDCHETLPPHTTRSTFLLPSASSWEDDLSAESGRISPVYAPSEITGLAIDKDFRGRFAERIASTSNLASMNKFRKTGSVVRFADEIPAELRMSKEPLSTTFGNKTRPSLPHRESIASVAISDGDSDEDSTSTQGLQRTASSLSLLLRRAQLEDGSLPFEIQPLDNSSRRKGKKKDTDIDEGEALLAMGRRGGVTKAGGIQLPPQQQLKDGVDSSFCLPSPDRIF